ncbi:MAG: anti-sigma factor, partial [Alphaproteobacteria bacterium]
MTGNEREELEGLAAEYALGTLAGEERDRFERRLGADRAAQRLVEEWQLRLAPLAEGVAPVEPPRTLWRRIEAALPGRAPA